MFQNFLETNMIARWIIVQQLMKKEEEHGLLEQEKVSVEGRFYLSALPFVVGPRDIKHL